MPIDGDQTFDDLLAGVIDEPDVREEILFSRWYRGMLDAALASRLRQGVTQTQIAELMSTKQPSITGIERDYEGRPSIRRVWAYLRACGLVPTANLLGEEEAFARLKADPTVGLCATSLGEAPRLRVPAISTDEGWMPLGKIPMTRVAKPAIGFETTSAGGRDADLYDEEPGNHQVNLVPGEAIAA